MGNCCSLGTEAPSPSPPAGFHDTNEANSSITGGGTPAGPVMIPPNTPPLAPILSNQELDSTVITQTLDHISDREGVYYESPCPCICC